MVCRLPMKRGEVVVHGRVPGRNHHAACQAAPVACEFHRCDGGGATEGWWRAAHSRGLESSPHGCSNYQLPNCLVPVYGLVQNSEVVRYPMRVDGVDEDFECGAPLLLQRPFHRIGEIRAVECME